MYPTYLRMKFYKNNNKPTDRSDRSASFAWCNTEMFQVSYTTRNLYEVVAVPITAQSFLPFLFTRTGEIKRRKRKILT